MIRTSNLPPGVDHCIWLIAAAPSQSELAAAVDMFDPTDVLTDWVIYRELARFMASEPGRTIVRDRAQNSLTRLTQGTSTAEISAARSDLLHIASTVAFFPAVGWNARDEFTAVANVMVGPSSTRQVASVFKVFLELSLAVLAHPDRYPSEPVGWHPTQVAP